MIDLAWLDALLNDPAFGPFARGLALARRFQFCVLFGGPEASAATLLLLEKQVAALRRAPVRRVLVFQGRALRRTRSNSEASIEEVMARLVEPEHPEEGVQPLFVLDASAAPDDGTGAWIDLFERLNQHRNHIVAALPGPFLLCLPPTLEARFAQAAADFWSIRGGVLVLPPEARAAQDPTGRPLRLVCLAAPEDADLLEEFEQQFAPLEQAGLVARWSERQARPGELLDVEIERRLADADMILFFLSPSLLGDPRYQGLMARAEGMRMRSTVVPLLLRPVLWSQTPLFGWQPIPQDGSFIGDAPDELRPAIWNEVLSEILHVFGYEVPQRTLGRRQSPALYYAPQAYTLGEEKGHNSGLVEGFREAFKRTLDAIGRADLTEDNGFLRSFYSAGYDSLYQALALALAGAPLSKVKAALDGEEGDQSRGE